MPSCTTCGASIPSDDAVCPDCSTRQIQTPAEPSIPGYRFLRRLGEGGMGEVFLAEDVTLGRRVAIKVVSQRVAADPTVLSRFSREARLLATIEHPNVVRVYSFGTVDDRPYLVMEYVEGTSLGEHIRNSGALPLSETLRILRETCEGLEAAQELNIIHRDIKPANILLDRRGRVRVADFGLAKRSAAGTADDESAITQSGYFVGSPHYLAPEQAQGEPTDLRSDIYSLGVVLYEMLTGERPFTGSTPIAVVARHLHDPLPRVDQLRPDLPKALVDLVARMTAKQRDERPQSYAEIVRELQEIAAAPLESEATVQQKVDVPAAPPGSTSRPPLRLIAAAGLAFAALFAVWWFQTRPLTKAAPAATASAAASDGRMTIAITPFYGPDSESEREGRLMAGLVEKSITTKLGRDEVRVIGIADTKAPVRSHTDARELAKRLGAHVVVWGEAFALRDETEIQPFLTVVGLENPESAAPKDDVPARPRRGQARSANLEMLSERDAGVVKLSAEAPNQIDLRKMSAEGVGQMATFLAGIDALHRKGDADRALALFDQTPESAELLRQRAQAYLVKQEPDRAIDALTRTIALQPDAEEARAQLADLLFEAERREEALAHYRQLAATGRNTPTRNAVLFGTQLLVKESITSEVFYKGERRATGNLLVVDPSSGVVQRRYPLPGYIQRFVPAPDRVTIDYRTLELWQEGDAAEGAVEYTAEGFAKPLIRGDNGLMRVASIRAGWLPASNFIRELHGRYGPGSDKPVNPRFVPDEEPSDATQPKTFAELETTLRAAIERDPTQPWYLFFLGQTLEATGRRAEAAAVWKQMLARDFDGVGYNEWAWMARYFDLLRQRAWGSAAAAKAEALRLAGPQPVLMSGTIERILNVGFVRIDPRQSISDADRYAMVLRMRRMSGAVEGDHLIGAAWRRHFEAKGDRERADGNAQWYRTSLENPFNLPVLAAYLDYLAYAVCAATLTLLLMLPLLFGPVALSRPRTAWREALRSLWQRAMHSPYRALVVIGVVTVAAMLLAWLYYIIDARAWMLLLYPVGAVIAVALIAVIAMSRSAFRAAIAGVGLLRRWCLIGLALFAVVSGVAFVEVARNAYRASNAPFMGLSDALGHGKIRTVLEESRRRKDTPAVRYALAVSHHLAGNDQEARELYGSLPHDARAVRGIARLAAKDQTVEMPSLRELIAVFEKPDGMTAVVYARIALDGAAATLTTWFAGITSLLLLIGLAAAFLFIRPAPVSEARRAHHRARWIDLILPGARSLRTGNPLWGSLQLLAFCASGIVLLTVSQLSFDVVGAPGVYSATSIQNGVMLPFPSSEYRLVADNVEFDPFVMMFDHPYAMLFWVVVGALFLFALLTHLATLLGLYRQWRNRRQDRITTIEIVPSETA